MNPTRLVANTNRPRFRQSLLWMSLVACLAPGIGRAGGSVSCWGANDLLQSDVPPGLTDPTALAAGVSHSLALKSDGTVRAWGSEASGAQLVPPGLSGVVALAAGSNYSLALQSAGTVQSWGASLNNAPDLTNVRAIAAGWTHALALKNDGSVVSWGSQLSVPPSATNVIAIAAGKGQSLALRADGTVVAWGDDSFGKAEVPAGLSNVVAVAAGADHCLALRKNGTLVGWGRNDSGQITLPLFLTNALAIAAGAQHSSALRADGSLISWGSDIAGQVSQSPSGTRYVCVAAGGDDSLAIAGDGSPVIVLQPVSQTVNHLLNATFTAAALGAPPLAYQWQHAGTNLAAATSSVLVIPAVQPYNGGTYTVVVSNNLNVATSSPATLTIGGLIPQILSSFQDTTIHCGDSVTFAVQAKGPTPSVRLSYQWELQGVPIAGATNTSLVLTNVNTSQAGRYAVVVTNVFGSASASAILTVLVDPPQITSPLQASATQGVPFQYTIQATHSPQSFGAINLPLGLALNPSSGVISGTPLKSGTFGPVVSAVNFCTTGTSTLMLNIASAAPILNTAPTAAGTAGTALQYRIVASGPNLSYSAHNLPPGLVAAASSGLISGVPVLAGDYFSVVAASNAWGMAQANVHFTITNAPIGGLSIASVSYSYSSPYLLDFNFSLLDDNDPTLGTGVIANPSDLTVTCFEDGAAISPSETGAFVARTITKVVKSYLVLDFTESIATLANGDTNHDGISDAVDNMVNGAIAFVDQQTFDAQIGAYEFHREDMAPNKVVGLTTDKKLVDSGIAGIWTNYVQGFPASSRCWDAVMAAVTGLGASNRDELHYVVLVSDGRDESSTTRRPQLSPQRPAPMFKSLR